ncbi:CASP-like protein 4A1 [Leguminivora glycinivorella]|uniref:CASP-like protein 4A1 n=1 Tax=Leguminivora glycinivorella TaxID=1035111 RepID=UPI00200FF20E|nr:CASP-like protein 4A1 [Leguminivora glycinivorella]
MGKRKRSRSRESDYNTILRKMKRLERKLKERRERSESPSSNSSGYNENYAYDRYYGVYTDEDTYDQVINLEEDIGDEERPRPTQLDPPPPPPPPAPAPAPAPATLPPPPTTQLPSTSLPVEAVPGSSSAVTLHEVQGADAENLPSTSRGSRSGGSEVIRDSLIHRGVPQAP